MGSTLFKNATVWLGSRSPSGEWATSNAVLIKGDRVIALGESAIAMGADTTVDCAAGFLAPAFADGHIHTLFGGLEAVSAPVRDCASAREVAKSVGRWAAEHPEKKWIEGSGFDLALAPGGIFQAAWLDEFVPDRPVYLRASDYHTVWVNSMALQLAGYVGEITQPHDGEIVVNELGAPVGTLKEWGAWRPVAELLPPAMEDVRIEALSQATAKLAAAGITWIQEGWTEPRDIETWIAAHQSGRLSVGVDLALWADPNNWRAQLESFVVSRDAATACGDSNFSATRIKFFADGIFESGTGALLEPYCGCPHSKGLPNWEPRELAAAVAAIDALGFTAHVHAIGDYAIRMTLDAFEQCAATNPVRDRRWVIVHSQLIAPTDIERFVQLGVVANFEPLWAQMDAWQEQLTAERLGPERAGRQFQIQTVADTGAVISFGSDWPVTTYNPLECLQIAVTRQAAPSSPPWMPHERVSVDDGLAAYTSGVAYQAGRDDAGVIRPGAIADLVLLHADPRRVAPNEIGKIEVIGTWRLGVRTFESF